MTLEELVNIAMSEGSEKLLSNVSRIMNADASDGAKRAVIKNLSEMDDILTVMEFSAKKNKPKSKK